MKLKAYERGRKLAHAWVEEDKAEPTGWRKDVADFAKRAAIATERPTMAAFNIAMQGTLQRIKLESERLANLCGVMLEQEGDNKLTLEDADAMGILMGDQVELMVTVLQHANTAVYAMALLAQLEKTQLARKADLN